MRNATTALVLLTALLGGPVTAAAQDKPAAEATSADAAEDAFLKAYFAEKELKDYASAEKAYAAFQSGAFAQASREVLARATLGRARCLRALKRDDEANALFARAEQFTDIKDVAAEAHAASQAASSTSDGSLQERIRSDISFPTWRDDVWKYGERGVPTLVEMLKDDSPESVYRAAESLARMESPVAHEALATALDARSSTYPEQVRNAASSDYACASAMNRLSEVKDSQVRRHALQRLVYGSDAKAIERVLEDSTLWAEFMQAKQNKVGIGRLLASAIARGGDARAMALGQLRDDELPGYIVAGLSDPPAAVLADGDALIALARHFRRHLSASDALLAAFVRHPETAVTGVALTLSLKRPAADVDGFVDAVARTGFGAAIDGSWSDQSLAERLVAALGPKPPPAALTKLAAAWPMYQNWDREKGRLPAFLKTLIQSGVSDEVPLLAFQRGLGSEWRFHQQFTQALQSARTTVGPWAVKAFLYELTLPTDREAHQSAAFALLEWQKTYGDAAGIEAHMPELVAALGLGGSPQITEVLEFFRPRSIEALKAALATHPRKAVVAESLATLGDKSSGDAIERVLAEVSDISGGDRRNEALESAIAALVRVKGDAAVDALGVALAAHGGQDGGKVLSVVRELVEKGVAFGTRPRAELCKLAIDKAPGALCNEGAIVEGLPTEQRRALAVLALRATSVQDRQWGAEQEKELLDVAAWDALLVAAEDQDRYVRDYAREALRLIRARENELAEFRAMGEERATRLRIESLLRPKDGEPRSDRVVRFRAGVAAIAATGDRQMVNELIRLAAEDEDDDVRDDARKALLAMAKPAVPAAQPPAEKK